MIQTAVSRWNRTALEDNSERITVLHHEEAWETLENLRENVRDNEGQFIALNVAEPLTESFPELFYAAMQNTRWEQSLPFSLPGSLPDILRHNPHAASPFINRAILWQRLCDRLIMDDAPYCETVLVLEGVDQASPATQHEITRLIRFHELHALHRTFVLTLDRHSQGQIIPALRDIIEKN